TVGNEQCRLSTHSTWRLHLNKEAHPPSKIWVSGPHLENLGHWKEMGTHVTIQNSELFKECDVIILGVKPGMLDEAINGCRYPCASNKPALFISMLAGVDLITLRNVSSSIRIIRIMPNTPMTIGQGICLYTPDKGVSTQDCKLLENLLSSSSVCEKVPESSMDTLGGDRLGI
ncbi:Pyrroline-5-carboxylate reductase, partial [Operophtera brumata]